MNTDTHDPFQLQRLLTRRGFLGLSGLGAAAAFGLTLDSAGAKPQVKRDLPVGARSAGADSGYHLPFALESSCVLSEDHFLVKVGKIDPAKDKVVAYSRADGQVEAILLQDGIVSQVYRDPAAAGGWNSREIAAGATDVVAGMASDKQKNLQLHVFFRLAAGTVRHLQEEPPSSDGTSSGQFTLVETLDWNASGALQITTDVLRNLLVFSYEPSSAPGKTDARLRYYWTANGFTPAGGKPFDSFSGTLSGFEFIKGSDQSRACAAIAFDRVLEGDLLLYVPDAAHSTVRVYSHLLYNSNHSSADGSVAVFNANQPPSFAPASIVSVDYLTTNKFATVPTAVVRTADQQLYTLSWNAGQGSWWNWQQLVLPAGTDKTTTLVWEPSNVAQSSNWSTSSNLLNLFIVVGQTLNVIRQVNQGSETKDATAPVFNPALPLQPGVAIAASQARPSSGDELIVVDTDGNLQELTKSADGGWIANNIHLPATEVAEVSTYRVQLTLSDNWGARVANRSLQITSSAAAIALLNGQGVTLSSTPVTLTTNRSGQVTIPIVADGLWAPKLTISGGGLSAPVTVSPSAPVNDYMTGTVTLNYLPVIDAATLAGASTSTGAPVFPLAKQHQDVAADAVTVLAGAAVAADPGVNGQVAREAMTQGLDGIEDNGHMPRTRHGRVAVGSPAAQGAATFKVDGIELSFSDLTGDALYAIKKGAAKVSDVAVSWDKTLKQWVSTITADFDTWAHQVLTIAIHDFEDAAHVFHGIINKLGAVLTDVIDWLTAHVLKLLTDTVTLAARYDGWLLQLSDELYTLTQKAKGGADQFLQGKEQEITAALASIKKQLGSRSISSFTTPPTFTAKLNAGPPSTPQEPNSANASWLLQKVTESAAHTTHTPIVDGALNTLITQIESSIATVGQDFVTATNKFRDTLASLVSNPKNFGDAGIGDLIDALDAVINAGLDAAQGVIDVALNLVEVAIAAFKAILSTPIGGLPLVGPLLKAAGMTKTLTVGGLVTLLVAFPTALGYKLDHLDAEALPFKNAENTSVLHAANSVDEDLSYTTFAATSFWALMDTIAASIVAGGDEPPALFSWIDIAAPAVISALTVPAHDDGLPFTSAIQLDDTADVYTAVSWALGALPGVFAGIAYYAGERYSEADAEVATKSTLFLTSLSGFGAAVFGVIAAVDTNTSLADAALPAVLAVLGNMAAALAYGLEKEVVASSDGISAILAGIIGGVCTFVGSVMDSFGVE